jgi:hypothetical protein
MLRAWRNDGCVQNSSAGANLLWVKRFRAYCAQRKLDERAELTICGAGRFITLYSRQWHLETGHLNGARTAPHALSRVYGVKGLNPPVWEISVPDKPPASALLRAYAAHLAQQRGSPAVTVHKRLDHVGKFVNISLNTARLGAR